VGPGAWESGLFSGKAMVYTRPGKLTKREIVGYGSIPINTIFRGMNIHLPAILMFTRGTRL